MPDEPPSPSAPRRWPRIAVLLVAYAGLLALGHWGGTWLGGQLVPQAGEPVRGELLAFLALGLLAYVVLLALPFVPGMEVSLAILAALGANAAIPVYIATLVALLIAYLAGQLVPIRTLAAIFGYVGLSGARDLVHDIAPMSRQQRIEALTSAVPTRFAPFLLRHRYLALAVALNMPGNAMIGGGGGIAMLAGMSGLFALPVFVMVIAIAVLPVPLAVVLTGR